jgi:hypothetical protein
MRTITTCSVVVLHWSRRIPSSCDYSTGWLSSNLMRQSAARFGANQSLAKHTIAVSYSCILVGNVVLEAASR